MTITSDEVFALAPYAKTLGVEFLEITDQQVVGRLAYSPAVSTVGGGIHGGAIMALADITAAVLATAASNGALPATTESSTYFLEPLRGDATATATALRVGRGQVVVEVALRDQSDRLCARVTQIVALIRPRE